MWPSGPHRQKERPNGRGKQSPGPPPHHDVPPDLEAICWSARGPPSPMVCTLMDRSETSVLPEFGHGQWAACLSKGNVRLTHPLHQVSREAEVPNTASSRDLKHKYEVDGRDLIDGHRKYAKQLVFTVTCKINHQHLGYAILLSIRLEIFPP